jgi:molecular chaperone HscC
MTDVCPHSLGIEVARVYGRHVDSGHFTPLLDRNVTVPVSRVERFHTLAPDQDRIEVKIFQGESRRTQENTFLGGFHVSGLRQVPGVPNGGEIDVRFSYDAGGILEVEVTVLSTGRKHVQVIQSRPGALTPEQVTEAVKRLQPLKTHPRDLLPNRARLERAHRLFRELTGPRRAELSSSIDAFEAALHAGDAARIGMTAAVLDACIADAFRDEGEAAPVPETPP